MPTIPYKNKAQFARMCKVSKSAITQACDRGTLFISKNGKINPKQPLNAAFLNNRLAILANEELEKKQLASRPAPQDVVKEVEISPEPQDVVVKEPIIEEKPPETLESPPEPQDVVVQAKKRKPYKKRKPKVQEPPPPAAPLGNGAPISKMDVEILRIQAQTTKINMEIAEKTGRFFLKEEVGTLFGKLSTTFANLIHPLGQRLAPDICDICGITDSAIMIEIQNLLEKELEIAITEVKRVSNDANNG